MKKKQKTLIFNIIKFILFSRDIKLDKLTSELSLLTKSHK